MNPIILIPSRLQSTRLPEKPLADIHGKPMIQHMVERAMAAQAGRVVVATDSEKIAEVVRASGGEVVMTDPDCPSGSDRIWQALEQIDPTGKHDIIINLQGDMPTFKAEILQQVLIPMQDAKVDIATLVAPIDNEEDKQNPAVVKAIFVIPAKAGIHAYPQAETFTRTTTAASDGNYYHHVGIYAYRRSALEKFISLPPSENEMREKLEQLRALDAGMTIGIHIIDEAPIGVDTPETLETARHFLTPPHGGDFHHKTQDLNMPSAQSNESPPYGGDIHILGIGNAIVDILGYVDDAELQRLGLKKSSMSLIDEPTATALYAKSERTTECSGGSAANTIAALAGLGLKTALVGKVKNDQLGQIFTHDVRALGVEFTTPPATSGASTARCLVYVTPDAERTMATYLGACTGLTIQDIDEAQIARAEIIYAEGYLWDQPQVIAMIEHAFALARKHGKKTAFTLSDTFCVARHREAFLKLAGEVDILFANESELMALFEESRYEDALYKLGNIYNIAAITRSAKGAVVLAQGKQVVAETAPVANLTDTTGAGDLFAAGFLYGIAKNMDVKAAAELGNKCAGRIIQQLGARSLKPLSDLLPAL